MPTSFRALSIAATAAIAMSTFATPAAQANNVRELLESISVCLSDFIESPNDRKTECTGGPAPRIEIRGFTPPPPTIIVDTCKVATIDERVYCRITDLDD